MHKVFDQAAAAVSIPVIHIADCVGERMASDGVRKGYDIAQLTAVRRECSVPLIASGGAGTAAHFAEVFNVANVDGALAASVFHSGALPIPQLKTFLRNASIEIRP